MIQGLRKKHIGRNIERIRELKHIKQETVAAQLNISQQAVSKMESSKEIDEAKLEKVAQVLGVSVEAIKNFDDENVVFHIENMHDNASANYEYNFNPIDKVVELYERMLKEKDEIIEIYKKQQKAS